MNQAVQKVASLAALATLWLTDTDKRKSLQKTLSKLGNSYHFVSHWRVKGTVKEVYETLFEDGALTRWWPSVYLNVKILDAGDARGIGKIVSLNTKGWLPYTLNWKFRVTEAMKPSGFSLEAWGDLAGTGVWSIKQNGQFADITFDWKVVAEKPLIRMLSFLFKPVFTFNHKWAMDKGEESLRLELMRRNAKSDKELKRIPPPPGPTTTSPIPLIVGLIAAFVILSKLFGCCKKK